MHAWLGHAYAGLGDAASAIREGQKAMAIDPTSSDPFEGPLAEESMAEIYAMLGDADHAIPHSREMDSGSVIHRDHSLDAASQHHRGSDSQ